MNAQLKKEVQRLRVGNIFIRLKNHDQMHDQLSRACLYVFNHFATEEIGVYNVHELFGNAKAKETFRQKVQQYAKNNIETFLAFRKLFPRFIAKEISEATPFRPFYLAFQEEPKAASLERLETDLQETVERYKRLKIKWRKKAQEIEAKHKQHIKDVKAFHRTLSSDKLNELWSVFMAYGRYDNNMYVRAKDKKEAYSVAEKYVEENPEDRPNPSRKNAERLDTFDESSASFDFVEALYKKDADALKLYNAEIDGYCYGSGT